MCDNLSTGYIAHTRDREIVLNGAYRELASHHPAAALPKSVRHHKGDMIAENTVGHVAAVVLVSRDLRFTNLAQLQQTVDERIGTHNLAPFQELPVSSDPTVGSEEPPLLRSLHTVTFGGLT